MNYGAFIDSYTLKKLEYFGRAVLMSKDLSNMNGFWHWLSKTVVISVYDAFFKISISIVLLSSIVLTGQSQLLFRLQVATCFLGKNTARKRNGRTIDCAGYIEVDYSCLGNSFLTIQLLKYNFVETPRKFIIAKLSIRKLRFSLLLLFALMKIRADQRLCDNKFT